MSNTKKVLFLSEAGEDELNRLMQWVGENQEIWWSICNAQKDGTPAKEAEFVLKNLIQQGFLSIAFLYLSTISESKDVHVAIQKTVLSCLSEIPKKELMEKLLINIKNGKG